MTTLIRSFIVFFFLTTTLHAKEYLFIGQEYPPYNWTEKNEITGLAKEVIEKVCQKLVIKCTFKIIPVKRGLDMVKNGKADGFMSFMQNEDRSEYSYFGAVFAKSNIAFITFANQTSLYKKIEDLKDTTIGVTANSASAKILYGYKKNKVESMTIVDEVTVITLLKKLHHHRYGKRGLIFLNEDVANYFLKQNNYNELKTAFLGPTQKLHIGFSKKSIDKKFADNFAITLNELKKTSELKDIYKKYGTKIE